LVPYFDGMTTEIEDLQLVWPRTLFLAEAESLINQGYSKDVDAVSLLFIEAFADGLGGQLVGEVCERFTSYRGQWQPVQPPDPWGALDPWSETQTNGMKPSPQPVAFQLLEEVISRVRDGALQEHEPKRYWTARHANAPQVVPVVEPASLRRRFIDLVKELDRNGYLDDAFGSNCCDAGVDREGDAAARLSERLRRPTAWPLVLEAVEDPEADGELFDLIEVFFDLVARPRSRSWHDYCREWDYRDHDRRAGQRLYLWRVNALLEQTSLGLGVSDDSADRGLLVRTVDDDRTNLAARVAADAIDPRARARIEHAATQMRSRVRTRETMRESVRALADVLEQRRQEARRRLVSQDEQDLFSMINNYDIRHLNHKQKHDYGDEFLEWMHWTLLSTLALMDDLAKRPQPPPGRGDEQ